MQIKCKFSHKNKPAAASSSNSNSNNNPLNRCKADLNNKKCQFGLKCWHAHRSSVNQRKDADKDIDDKIAKAKQICKCCGRKGHTAKECNKLKAHLDDIKKAVGYTGDITWFDNDANAKRCQEAGLCRNGCRTYNSYFRMHVFGVGDPGTIL